MEFVKKHDKTAIIYDDNQISYKEMIRFSKYYSTLLNLKKEEKVMIFSPNRPELVYSFLGTWENGGTCINIDYSNSVEELVYVLKDSKPEYIFTVRESKEKLNEAMKLYGEDAEILYFEDINVPSDFTIGEEEWINSPNPDSIALMLYTSGTTGDPKGVMISFDNIMAQVEALSKFEVFKKEDIFLAFVSLSF